VTRRSERGGVSWISLLLLAAVVGGGYLGVVWVPLYIEFFEVKQIVADYMNQAIKNRSDDQLRKNMVAKIQITVQVPTVDDNGKRVRVPAFPLDESAITWERDETAMSLRVAFEYERSFVYPLLDRPGSMIFRIDRVNDLTPPDWGPSR
jgi:hypothetical protein